MKWMEALVVVLLFTAFDVSGEEPAEVPAADYLEVIEPVKNFDQQEQFRTVSVVGFLKNSSSWYIEDIVIEAQFYDDNGKLIDSATEKFYSMIVPPNDSVSFVVSTQAQRDAKEYASFKTRVIYADKKDQCTSTRKKNQNWFISALINWVPLIIILGAWIVIMMRFQKKSPQIKVVALVEQQNELIQKNGEQFKEFLEVVREYTKKST